MSKSLDLARYPSSYTDLARRYEEAVRPGGTGRREQWYVVKSEKAAQAARLDLYGFQRALRHAGRDDLKAFATARLFIARKPWRVRVVHPDDTAPPVAKRK